MNAAKGGGRSFLWFLAFRMMLRLLPRIFFDEKTYILHFRWVKVLAVCAMRVCRFACRFGKKV